MMETTNTTALLSTVEQDELARCESTIHAGLTTFYEVGAALLAIRDGRLYRATHRTFEDYCQERWGISRRHANRLIGARTVQDNLGPIGPKLPATESQARPLTALRPADQPVVWQRAVETAEGGQVTAAHVERTAAEFRAAQPDPASSPFIQAVATSVEQSGSYRDSVLLEQYYAATTQLMGAVHKAKDLVRHCEPEEIARLLTNDEARGEAFMVPMMEWFFAVFEARQQNATVRRVK